MTGCRGKPEPEGRHGARTRRETEQLVLQVLKCLPDAEIERTRDVIQVTWGGEAGVVVLVTPEAVEFRLPTIEWTEGAYGPAPSSRLWRRVRAKGLTAHKIATLMEQARVARLRQFRKCRFCGESFPPERRHGRDVCQGCAEKHLGVVH